MSLISRIFDNSIFIRNNSLKSYKLTELQETAEMKAKSSKRQNSFKRNNASVLVNYVSPNEDGKICGNMCKTKNLRVVLCDNIMPIRHENTLPSTHLQVNDSLRKAPSFNSERLIQGSTKNNLSTVVNDALQQNRVSCIPNKIYSQNPISEQSSIEAVMPISDKNISPNLMCCSKLKMIPVCKIRKDSFINELALCSTASSKSAISNDAECEGIQQSVRMTRQQSRLKKQQNIPISPKICAEQNYLIPETGKMPLVPVNSQNPVRYIKTTAKSKKTRISNQNVFLHDSFKPVKSGASCTSDDAISNEELPKSRYGREIRKRTSGYYAATPPYVRQIQENYRRKYHSTVDTELEQMLEEGSSIPQKKAVSIHSKRRNSDIKRVDITKSLSTKKLAESTKTKKGNATEVCEISSSKMKSLKRSLRARPKINFYSAKQLNSIVAQEKDLSLNRHISSEICSSVASLKSKGNASLPTKKKQKTVPPGRTASAAKDNALTKQINNKNKENIQPQEGKIVH